MTSKARASSLCRSVTSNPGLRLCRKPLPPALRRSYSSIYTPKKKERVVILGSGWAGYGLARTLSKDLYDPIVISPRSYFVFTPLLAGTAVGTLEFRTVLEPVRRAGVGFYHGWADDVDFERKVVRVEANANDDMVGRTVIPPPPPPTKGPAQASEAAAPRSRPKAETFDVPYDKLVVAVGAYSQTFGIQGVREHAHFLRDVGDARRIRLRVLSLFEQCSYPSRSESESRESGDASKATLLTDADKRALLHFAIVGGGPTGIEYAAELHDLIYEDLRKLYPDLMQFVRITVYDVAPKVLPMFDQALADYAMKVFNRNGIAVKTQHHLERIRPADGYLGSDQGGLKIKIKEYGDEEVSAGLVVWSTGLMQNPLVKKLEAKAVPGSEATPETIHHLLRDKRTGGIMVDPYLRARTTTSTEPASGEDDKGTSVLPDVYVIGDCAVVQGDGMLPKTAQVASQQAAHLARRLNKGEADGKPFRFRNWGTLTYLGGWKAIHQSEADKLRGWLAWVLWRGAYLTRSMSWRNKFLVPVYWFVTWVFGRGISKF
ncbi:FAD/NAD(P)-binding domain-containing protein [Coniochaeta ligniaria NRRL 30616]|uniref:FAD/NAD(P)-binding domain-containing protein n=1 Tax=Coniochaeta ligniaria NRRL 30616 TaxID=1408157 RepID=A0A1J7JX43_9PEZI|nr:FAD/NAD(P)-binding domain-containing protein [Coniochaeta ligniaria NRRL 30616]